MVATRISRASSATWFATWRALLATLIVITPRLLRVMRDVDQIERVHMPPERLPVGDAMQLAPCHHLAYGNAAHAVHADRRADGELAEGG
jgi:hypothetical protein